MRVGLMSTEASVKGSIRVSLGFRVPGFGFWFGELSIFRVESAGSGFQCLEVRVYVWFRGWGFQAWRFEVWVSGLGD